jgi:Xaa-Pro dipeptidase
LSRIESMRRSAFKDNEFDFFVIFDGANLTYFSGFSGAAALLIPPEGKGVLFVPSVNFEQGKTETVGLRVELMKRGENLMEKIAGYANASKSARFAVDTLPIESWRALVKAVGGEGKLELANNIVREIRAVKDEKEIALVRKACDLASVGMQVAFETVKSGVKEKEVAAEVEFAMRKKGSDGVSFDTIIASGMNSAFPHGTCSDRIIRSGDLVVVDLGATYGFYRSDMTRTFTVGEPSGKQREIYEAVKLAHQKAFTAMKPGTSTVEVDAEARRVIEAANYGEFFVHNLGHGVGLEIHEAPVLSPYSKDVLAVGNVVTDEPGIYLTGYGGVRIEDTVLVSHNGAEKLTIGPYTLTDTT